MNKLSLAFSTLYYYCTKLRDKMKKYIHIFLCLMIVTSGCAKKKNNTSSTPQNSIKKTSVKKSNFDENLEAFTLDDDALHNFAHESNTSSEKPFIDSIAKSSGKNSSMFEWENVSVDQSKNEFKAIYFAFDKYHIDGSQELSLQSDIEHARKMISLNKTIVIEGHACDSAGSAIYNMTLSEQRAKFIATKFIESGIDKAHIKIAARGQEMPVVKGGNREHQALNRRVEVFAIDSK